MQKFYRYEIPIHISWQTIKQQNLVFVLNKKNEVFYTFNDIGTQIWDLAVSGKTAAEIQGFLVELSDSKIDAEEISQFLKDLEAEELLTKMS
ncbi:hypothetical protein B9G55_11665 [Saccharibacillus sp. O16]|nr:hypothetical protein B9G55_11665 [Saccharibacillus sp. O16]